MGLVPVTDLERRILVLLHETPTLTGSKLAEDLGIGRGAVKEYLRRLKAKGGCWFGKVQPEPGVGA